MWAMVVPMVIFTARSVSNWCGRGIYWVHWVSAQVIQNWVLRNPDAGEELLFHNPSYVFFRELRYLNDHLVRMGR